MAERYAQMKENWAKEDHPVNEWRRKLNELQTSWKRDLEMKGQRIWYSEFPNLLLHTGSATDATTTASSDMQGWDESSR